MATARKKPKKKVNRLVAKVKSIKTSSNARKQKALKASAKPSAARKEVSAARKTVKSSRVSGKSSAKAPTLKKAAKPHSAAVSKVTKSHPAKRVKSGATKALAPVVAIASMNVVEPATIKRPTADTALRSSNASAKAVSIAPTVADKETGTLSSTTPAQIDSGIAVPQSSIESAVKKQFRPSGSPKASIPIEVEESASKLTRNSNNRQGFKTNEFVVYPAHGVGQIVSIEEQEVAGFTLELFVINFAKDKMTLRVPTSKVSGVGMRKLSDADSARKSLEILTGRPRIKRTMWSRRAQEYEAKINSGDIDSIAEVVRDLYRSEAQPEQSYSERQLYEAALDRMAREIAVVQKLDESEALKVMIAQLQKGQKRGPKAEGAAEAASGEPSVEEAA